MNPEDGFVFSQLNFNGDENQRRERKRNKPAPKTTNENIPNSPNNSDTLIPKNRPITMSIFVSQDLLSRPSFDSSKYISTPKGLIHNTIFSNKTPNPLTDVHYLLNFPQPLINDALVIFSECENVLHFVLDQILQLPCYISIRWGVLFNLKFRRVFQCLTLEKWDGLYQVLKKHGYAKITKGCLQLLDPNFDAPENIFDDKSFDYLENLLNTETPPTKNSNHEPNFTIDTVTPQPLRLPVDSPAIVPVQRARNNSIYAIHLSHSVSPALADRFNPSTFPPSLTDKISEIYFHSETIVNTIINQLKQLPVGIPLRWGVIYNKHLRIRSQAPGRRDSATTLEQWNQLKSLLITNGYIRDKTVANCVILINKAPS